MFFSKKISKNDLKWLKNKNIAKTYLFYFFCLLNLIIFTFFYSIIIFYEPAIMVLRYLQHSYDAPMQGTGWATFEKMAKKKSKTKGLGRWIMPSLVCLPPTVELLRVHLHFMVKVM